METYKALLTQKINELLSEAGKTVTEMTNGKENYPDPNDRASLEADRNFWITHQGQRTQADYENAGSYQKESKMAFLAPVKFAADRYPKKTYGQTGYHPLHRLQNQTGKNGKNWKVNKFKT